MKQLTLNLRSGAVNLSDVPAPIVKKGHLLIKTHKSLISAGTEQMLVDFGRSSLIGKALKQPERLNQVWEKIKNGGVVDTFRTVRNQIDRLIPLGYCNAGEVIAIGEGVVNFKKGDRVVSNGPHAQIVSVPVNLAVKIPENLGDEDAVFTVPAAVALQSIRLLKPALGETVAVFGLGLIGQLTAQLLRVNGCQVIGIDPDTDRIALAQTEIVTINPLLTRVEPTFEHLTSGRGVDGVIIAAASKSNEIISQAAAICRKKGKIILSGSVGMHLQRTDFYKKELSFEVSCSYGPGRYDALYEKSGADYPYPYVRWTENRNFEAVIQLLAEGQLYVRPLVSRMVPLEDYHSVYDRPKNLGGLATIFEYGQNVSMRSHQVTIRKLHYQPTKCVAGMIGAGNFARNTMLPLLKNKCVKYLASENGLSATELASKYKIPYHASDYQEVLSDKEIDLVIIATRHDLHAELTIRALRAGKHVFVEKPLALHDEELHAIIQTWRGSDKSVTVGFNRRFSPYITKMRELLGDSKMNIVMIVNAGALEDDHWLNDPDVGGGRLLGEACHFVDLVGFLAASLITEVCANNTADTMQDAIGHADILIKCANGSSGSVHYYNNGSGRYQKERIEVYSAGRTFILNDFCCLEAFGIRGVSKWKLGRQKGHKQQFEQLFDAIEKGGQPLISPDELINSAKATLAVLESLKTRSWVKVA